MNGARCLPMVAVACVLALGGGGASGSAAPPPAESSEVAPLAEQSLLLDAAAGAGRLVAVGDRGHVLVSTNDAASWKQVVVPVRSMLTGVELREDGNGWAVGHDAAILHTGDGGETWDLQHWAPELEQPLFDVWFADAQRGVAIGAYGLYLETRDGGASWTPRTIDEEEPHLYHLARGPGETLYMVGEFGSIYRSGDRGTTWTKSDSPYDGSFFGALAVGDQGVLVFGLRGNLFRSADGGGTWSPVRSGASTGLFGGIRLEDGTIVLTGQGGMVTVSRDDGVSFTPRKLENRRAISSALPLGTDRILLVGESGVAVLDPVDSRDAPSPETGAGP